MRVLLIVRNLQMGGVERQTITLANAMNALGHEVHILSLKHKQQLFADAGVFVHFYDLDKQNRKNILGLLFDLITRIFLAPLIPRSGFIWRGMYGAIYLKKFMCSLEQKSGAIDRVIVLGQGAFERVWPIADERFFQVIVDPLNEPTGSLVEYWFTRLLFSGKRCIAISSGVRDSIEQMVNHHGIQLRLLQIVHNPIPVTDIEQLSRESAAIPRHPYIVHVARLTPVKNQSLLLRAYHTAQIDELLVIVGDGNEMGTLESLAAELGISDKVIFVGYQQNPYPWMRHARLFVLTSKHEGFGLVLAESMACGTPCVSVDCRGGIRDVLIEEQAEYICESDVDALAAMIRHGLGSPPKIKPEWYLRFNSKAVAQKMLDLVSD